MTALAAAAGGGNGAYLHLHSSSKRARVYAAAALRAVCARRQWQVAKGRSESGRWNEEVLSDGRHQGKQFGNQAQAHCWTSEEP